MYIDVRELRWFWGQEHNEKESTHQADIVLLAVYAPINWVIKCKVKLKDLKGELREIHSKSWELHPPICQ